MLWTNLVGLRINRVAIGQFPVRANPVLTVSPTVIGYVTPTRMYLGQVVPADGAAVERAPGKNVDWPAQLKLWCACKIFGNNGPDLALSWTLFSPCFLLKLLGPRRLNILSRLNNFL